jgi:hypothetical protein
MTASGYAGTRVAKNPELAFVEGFGDDEAMDFELNRLTTGEQSLDFGLNSAKGRL